MSAIGDSIKRGIMPTKRMYRKALTASRLTLPFYRLSGNEEYFRELRRYFKIYYKNSLGSLPQHPSAVRIRAWIPAEWQNYSKFCIVRNPWDKTASDYFWRIRNRKNPPDFYRYVKALAEGDPLDGVVPINVHSNWEMYMIDNKIAVDHVIKFENLMHDLGIVLHELSIPWDGWLPRAKSEHRPKRKGMQSYRDLYDEERRNIVRRLYEPEIEYFKYKFK